MAFVRNGSSKVSPKILLTLERQEIDFRPLKSRWAAAVRGLIHELHLPAESCLLAGLSSWKYWLLRAKLEMCCGALEISL